MLQIKSYLRFFFNKNEFPWTVCFEIHLKCFCRKFQRNLRNWFTVMSLQNRINEVKSAKGAK
jgi:hypothetical protein